uniref:Uncharacterized protein n=1 Tax=uncultured Thiotrichaceae bacterium TaxID=298394 RepID=A0A6S6T6D7_9GAMM|nr:MAG: Unknown protein [uncultured Thiotrichaceae bacterium]
MKPLIHQPLIAISLLTTAGVAFAEKSTAPATAQPSETEVSLHCATQLCKFRGNCEIPIGK